MSSYYKRFRAHKAMKLLELWQMRVMKFLSYYFQYEAFKFSLVYCGLVLICCFFFVARSGNTNESSLVMYLFHCDFLALRLQSDAFLI